MRRKPKTYSDDPLNEDSYVMLFQLFGVPCLNQKAREVPPFRSSLTSSGLFLMLGKMRLIFWIGYEYHSCYLDEDTFKEQNQLISEDLLGKLM